MQILDLEIEHLARARQRGFQREAAIRLLLRHAEQAQARSPERPALDRPAQLGPAARFLAVLAGRA